MLVKVDWREVVGVEEVFEVEKVGGSDR